MYKPYTVECVNFIISRLRFEDTTIFTYKFDHNRALRDAAALNGAYYAGFMEACSIDGDKEGVLKYFFKS